MTDIQKFTESFFGYIKKLINKAQERAAIFVIREATLLFWSIGEFINTEIREKQLDTYGSGIIAKLSQQLTVEFADKLHRAIEITQKNNQT